MKNLIYIVCWAVLLVACQKESDSEIFRGKSGSIVLEMMPNKLSDDAAKDSRATEPGDDLLNENKVGNVHVFFFPHNAADNQQCLKYETISGLSFQGTGTFSQELSTPKTMFNVDVVYDIYTVVNLPSDVVVTPTITLGALKALRTVTPVAGSGAQNTFVMDGKTSAVLNPTQTNPVVYVNMPLKRAISKIRVKFVLSPSAGVAAATSASVSIRHFAKRSSLLDGNPSALTTNDYDNTSYIFATPNDTFTFYCYENNWNTTAANETFLMVNLPYGAFASNYYRIAINKYANSSQTGRIARNMIYDVTAYIDNNGTDTESGTVAINSNCTITDWTTREIVLKTITQHYLGISEYNIIMPNISTFTLKYVSDLPISITGVTASCIQYSTTGVASNVTYTSGQSQFPTFTVNSATSTITINSAIPINYVPKNMTFTVTNNIGLSLSATIVQYPARYVAARLSAGNVKPQWNPGGTNLNLFTVNTLVPSSNGSYTLGDPTNGGAKTDSTAIGNKMVSPRFIIASQYGIFTREVYGVAQNRCYQYGEDIYRSGWRLPTKSEIELINVIQDDTNSAVKALLTGDAYWSAYKYDYYNFTNNVWINEVSTGTAYVRCVYDVYKDEL